ncbi:hypothetical protein HYW76_03505 [Candidatus Pacearchaeota archaeon]|nr:hypothetical protein [Candidatus Pacearchaeota archaeon]
MAVKIPVAQARLFKNVFICKTCGKKMRADPKKISEGKVKCRKCQKKSFKSIRKK